MKFSRSIYVKAAAVALALAAVGTASVAQARSNVFFSVGANVAPGVAVGVSNAPVYYPPGLRGGARLRAACAGLLRIRRRFTTAPPVYRGQLRRRPASFQAPPQALVGQTVSHNEILQAGPRVASAGALFLAATDNVPRKKEPPGLWGLGATC